MWRFNEYWKITNIGLMLKCIYVEIRLQLIFHEVLFVRDFHFSCLIILTFDTEHISHAVRLCVKCQNYRQQRANVQTSNCDISIQYHNNSQFSVNELRFVKNHRDHVGWPLRSLRVVSGVVCCLEARGPCFLHTTSIARSGPQRRVVTSPLYTGVNSPD